MSQARTRPFLPPLAPPQQEAVFVYHPNANATDPAIVSFCAYDRSPAGDVGVDYYVVLEACYIVSNNRHGYLSTSRGHEGQVSTSATVLLPGIYYFMVVEDDMYEIVTSFDDWQFPKELPTRWNISTPIPQVPSRSLALYSTSAMARNVTQRDNACLLTGYPEGTHNCHILPQANCKWYLKNKMWLFTQHTLWDFNLLQSKIVHASGNGLTLRPDIHHTFDSHSLVFIVKDNSVVCHFLDPSPLLAGMYHNVAIPMPDDVPLEIMYARFALAVISRAAPKESKTPSSTSGSGKSVKFDTPGPTVRRSSVSKPSGGNIPRISEHHDFEGSPVKRHEDDELDNAATNIPLYDIGDDKLAEAFYENFPDLRQEVTYSSSRHWQTLGLHPETLKMNRLRDEWFNTHPNVRETTGLQEEEYPVESIGPSLQGVLSDPDGSTSFNEHSDASCLLPTSSVEASDFNVFPVQ